MRNLVLVCLDTLRKDYFDRFAPRTRALADVSFEQCRAASIWSAPSHASMLSGVLPHQHGVHAGSPTFDGLDRDRTVLGELDDHYAVGVSANPYASSDYGFDRLFDEFHDVDPHSRFPDGLDLRSFVTESDRDGPALFVEFIRAAAAHDRPVESVLNAVLAGVDRLSQQAPIPKLFDYGASIVTGKAVERANRVEEPFFLFVNFMDAHTPLQHLLGYDRRLHSAPMRWICDTDHYDPWEVVANIEDHEEYLRYRRGLYAAAVDHLDRKLVEFVERITAATDRETTFVVTADHGENLGYPDDHRLVTHKGSLTESLLHVPLCVINAPHDYPAADAPYVSHLNLRTLLVDLVRERRSELRADRVPAEVIGLNGLTPTEKIADFEYWDRMIRCVYDGDRKVVWDSQGTVETYAIDRDRPCRETLVEANAERPPWRGTFFDVSIADYKPYQRSMKGGDEDIGAATRRRLEYLGYT